MQGHASLQSDMATMGFTHETVVCAQVMRLTCIKVNKWLQCFVICLPGNNEPERMHWGPKRTLYWDGSLTEMVSWCKEVSDVFVQQVH